MVSSRKDLKLLRNPFWPLRHPRLAASATGSARRRSPARACRGQILSNKKETVTKTVTVSFWQGQKDLVSPAGSVGASAYFVCRGLHRRPAPLDTLRVPWFKICFCKKRTPFGIRFFPGRGRRTWTLGTWFWRPLLYQLSYTPILNWCTIRDSNPGPTGYEPVALTNWANGPRRLTTLKHFTKLKEKSQYIISLFLYFYLQNHCNPEFLITFKPAEEL